MCFDVVGCDSLMCWFIFDSGVCVLFCRVLRIVRFR